MAQPETFFDNLLEKFRKRGSSQQYTNTLFRVIGTIRVSSYEVSCRPIDLELPLIIWEFLAIGYRRFSRLAPAIPGNGDHNLPLAPPLSAEDARHLLGYFFHQVVINGVGSLSFTPLLNEFLRIQPRQAPCLVAHVVRSTPPPVFPSIAFTLILPPLPLKPLVKLTRNRYSAFPHAYLIQYPDARHGASP